MLKLHVLASGSKGNASIIENTASGHGVMIDCGVTKRAFFERCGEVGFDPANLDAIVFTHEHTDHTKGAGVVMRGLARAGIHPVMYANPLTMRASSQLSDAFADCGTTAFESQTAIDEAGMTIIPFLTSHDAATSFGFRVEADGDALGFMTDTGVVTPEAHAHLADVRILAIEANHDIDMLEHGPYPYYVQQRIASPEGHLSNAQSADELSSLLCNRLQHVVAMHVSQNNNDYSLPKRALGDALARESHHAEVRVGFQERVISVG